MTSTTYAPILPPPPHPAPVMAPCWKDKDLFVPQFGNAGVVSLPAVCVKCGQPATVQKKKVYYWHTPWLYLVILAGILVLVVGLGLTAFSHANAVEDSQGRGHYMIFTGLIFGGIAGIIRGIYNTVRSG